MNPTNIGLAGNSQCEPLFSIRSRIVGGVISFVITFSPSNVISLVASNTMKVYAINLKGSR